MQDPSDIWQDKKQDNIKTSKPKVTSTQPSKISKSRHFSSPQGGFPSFVTVWILRPTSFTIFPSAVPVNKTSADTNICQFKRDDQKWSYTWTLMLDLRCWQSTLVQWADLQTCARPPGALGSVPSSPASTAAPSGCKTNRFHDLFSKETCFIVKIRQQSKSKHKYLSVVLEMTMNESFMTLISSINIKLHSSFHGSSAFTSISDTQKRE